MSALSLYEIESELQCLLDTEDGGIDESQREEFERLMIETQMKAVEKRERVFRFLASLEASQDAIKAEETRLATRRKKLAATHERVSTYIAGVIKAIGPGKDGNYCKLVGETCEFSLRKSPASVEITNPEQIPAEYLTEKIEYSPRKDDIKKALQANIEVPGAKLITDKYKLRVS
jgi:hypothetical protein